MRRWGVVPAIIVLCMASCATEQGRNGAGPAADREGRTAEADVSASALEPLDDGWSRWLLGQWEITAESDLAQFKGWVKGRVQMIRKKSRPEKEPRAPGRLPGEI